jgi:phosphate transport system permease protein
MKQKRLEKIIESLIKFSGYIIIVLVIAIILNIIYRGLFYKNQFIFNLSEVLDTSSEGMLYALINTLKITFFGVIIGFPIGLGTAIYLIEYKIKNKILKRIINFSIITLSGIPSIIYGVFGLAIFGLYFKLGLSFWSGALTMALMMIPITIIAVKEELKSVPNMYREASFGLGANKFQTIFKIIIPSAIRGIINSFLLSISRILGESAALLITVDTLSRTLTLYIYGIRGNEELALEKFYALIGQASLVLTIVIIIIVFISQKIEKKGKK